MIKICPIALKKIALQIMSKIAQKFSYLTQTFCLKSVNVHGGGNFYLVFLNLLLEKVVTKVTIICLGIFGLHTI